MHVISSLILSILRSWYQKATPINCIKVIKWSLLEQNQSPARSQEYLLNELMQNDESSDTRTTTMNSQESTPGAILRGEHSYPNWSDTWLWPRSHGIANCSFFGWLLLAKHPGFATLESYPTHGLANYWKSQLSYPAIEFSPQSQSWRSNSYCWGWCSWPHLQEAWSMEVRECWGWLRQGFPRKTVISLQELRPMIIYVWSVIKVLCACILNTLTTFCYSTASQNPSSSSFKIADLELYFKFFHW